MFNVMQTEMICLNITLDEQQTSKATIIRYARQATQEAERLIGQNKTFYLCCNGINYFPYPLRKDAYTSLYGIIEHFIYKSVTAEGDAFISLLRNQIYPAKWACTILLRELYVAVVMQNCQLSPVNHQALIEIIDGKLKYHEESANVFGSVGSPIEDSTAKTLFSIFVYIKAGNLLSKDYLAQKVS